MKKIVITNGYTWYNKGDSGILLGTVNTIKQIFGRTAEITILSFTPEEDAKRYCKDPQIKGVYSNILNPYPFKKTIIGKPLAIGKLGMSLASTELRFKLNKNKLIKNNKGLKAIDDSDLIIVCGGGFLGGKKFNSFMHLYQMNINSQFNKPVILWGTSIEPIKNKIVGRFTEKEILKLTHIFPRETITYNYLQEFISNDKITLIPDMAFMLDNKEKEFKFIKELRKKFDNVIGITVRKWNFPNAENAKKATANYVNSIVDTIVNYSENNNTVFVFVPQVIFEGDDDSKMAEIIKEKLPIKYKNNFIIRKDDWSPIEIKGLINNFDIFVGTRMHSNIFATSMGVPTVAIAYEKKTNGIMETVGLQEYVEEIDSITSESLINKINNCLEHRVDIRKHLNNRILEIRKDILDKSMFIKEL
ncbi:MAG: polysaccharide pyruvyl transferase family protein [Paraclostridium sordellii]